MSSSHQNIPNKFIPHISYLSRFFSNILRMITVICRPYGYNEFSSEKIKIDEVPHFIMIPEVLLMDQILIIQPVIQPAYETLLAFGDQISCSLSIHPCLPFIHSHYPTIYGEPVGSKKTIPKTSISYHRTIRSLLCERSLHNRSPICVCSDTPPAMPWALLELDLALLCHLLFITSLRNHLMSCCIAFSLSAR